MNSPDPGSPISTDSSGSPPPDDSHSTGTSGRDPHTSALHAATHMLGSIASMMPSPGSKRRLPGGSSFDGSSSRRDAKTRRREDVMSAIGNPRRLADMQGQSAGGSGFGQAPSNPWGVKSEHGPRRDKEDLVDVPMAEQLRKG
jgi:hypothetical protein